MSLGQVLRGPLREPARRVRSTWRHLRRSLQPAVNEAQLVDQLRSGGIERGDVLMVHASLARLGNVDGGAGAVVRALVTAVGEDGTILMPAYGLASRVIERQAAGDLVDLRTEKSGSGAIGEVLRKLPDTRRSSHPFSSVCANGRLADWIVGDHADAPQIWHQRSPIGRLLEAGGKVVGLGTTMGPVTFYHVLEDTWDGFPIPTYSAPFVVRYIDAEGAVIEREVMRFRPELGAQRIDAPRGAWIRRRMTRHLDRQGLRRRFRFGHGKGWVVEAKPLYEALKALAEEGITIYTTKQEWRALGRPAFSAPERQGSGHGRRRPGASGSASGGAAAEQPTAGHNVVSADPPARR